ncbi:MarC family protein [uncultured Dechloromonas sp.]|uniref:MarC family protein n=1 Tax=uncultured Dechloromonas sp. TaxID=171719 RepID=UPI0025E16EEA|nr:MarC family protein [uncultured Dechloromonas sp.]
MQELLSTVFLLLLLLDPLGNIPLLLSLLRGFSPSDRQRIVLRESAIAGGVLLLFVFVGDWLLAAMRLSEQALEISGGLILFMIALRMVFPVGSSDEAADMDGDPLIVPLAIPMIAGPSALATVLLNARQTEHPTSLVLAIVIAVIINTLILLSAGRLARLFGKAGLAAMERLMGLILTTIAVQMLISGVRVAFSLPPQPMIP